MAALSRSFDYFFSGYLNTIWREFAPEQTFIIYSGGDDLLIVGSWDKIIELAKKIRDDFEEYTCRNTAFSVSGGVAIISPKFPIMKGADLSGNEEQNAKFHNTPSDGKNSISFLGTPLNWNTEFPIVEKLKDILVKLLLNNHLPKSFLSKVLSHCENANIQHHSITNIKTYWMIAYDLSRFKDRNASPETKQLIERCINEICNNSGQLYGQTINSHYHTLELWAFACRWAELEYRTKNTNNKN